MDKDNLKLTESEWRLERKRQRAKRFKNSFFVQMIIVIIEVCISATFGTLAVIGSSYGMYKLLSMFNICEEYITKATTVYGGILGAFVLAGAIYLAMKKICIPD